MITCSYCKNQSSDCAGFDSDTTSFDLGINEYCDPESPEYGGSGYKYYLCWKCIKSECGEVIDAIVSGYDEDSHHKPTEKPTEKPTSKISWVDDLGLPRAGVLVEDGRTVTVIITKDDEDSFRASIYGVLGSYERSEIEGIQYRSRCSPHAVFYAEDVDEAKRLCGEIIEQLPVI